MDETTKWKLVANERLRGASQPLPSGARVPFICECDDPWCLGRVDIALWEYDHVREEGGLVRISEHGRHSPDRKTRIA
jgi:hypothetical protein